MTTTVKRCLWAAMIFLPALAHADTYAPFLMAAVVIPLAVSPSSVTIVAGHTAPVTVTHAHGTVSATSDNTGIATVSYSSGIATITAVSAGSATVTIGDTQTSQPVAVTVTSGSGIMPVLNATRTSGIGPLGVQFDAVGTTSANVTSLPFHEIRYSWDFGDCGTSQGAATWSYGAGAGVNQKCKATGPVAGHVFDGCHNGSTCTYTVTLTAHDGTNSDATATTTVTVTDPAGYSGFAGTHTLCAYNTTKGTGCPTGADELPTSDWHAVTQYARSGGTGNGPHAPYAQVLVKRGDSFTMAGTVGYVTTTGQTWASYGDSGAANPLITYTESNSHGLQIGDNSASNTTNDVRIMDLEFTGGSTNSGFGIYSLATVSNVTILRVSAHDMINPFDFTNNLLGPGYGWALVDSLAYNVPNTGGSSGRLSGFFLAQHSFFLGNFFNNNFGGEHVARWMQCYYCAITDNTTENAGALSGSKASLVLRATAHGTGTLIAGGDSQYVAINNNLAIGSPGGGYTTSIEPQGSEDDRIFDVVFEDNITRPGATSGQQVALSVTTLGRITVRNNVFDLTGATAHTGLKLWRYAAIMFPHDLYIYNNTIYDGDVTSTDFVGFQVDYTQNANPDGSTGVQNVFVKNNLMWAPSDSQHLPIDCTDGTNHDATNALCTAAGDVFTANSTSAQIIQATPFVSATPSAPADFAPCSPNSATCYATGGGTSVPVWSDFFGSVRSGTPDMGAVKH